MLIAIHQPNWLPWLGYFHKIACADTFVFLEDVQFSKGSYTNRVRILLNGRERWLSQPIKQKFGQRIADVEFSDPNWVGKHMSLLSTAYNNAPAYPDVFPLLSEMFESFSHTSLATFNRNLIEAISNKLGLSANFLRDSELAVGSEGGDDRLIALVRSCASGKPRYLSGAGGRGYQDEDKFRAAGIDVEYTDFQHPRYDQGDTPFVPGLSIVDSLFRVGWHETARLVTGDTQTAP